LPNNNLKKNSEKSNKYKAIKVGINLLVTWGRLKLFFFGFSLDSKCNALEGPISTFAPIGMLDLSSTLAFKDS